MKESVTLRPKLSCILLYGHAKQTGMYILQVGPFFSPTGPDQGPFFSLFSFSVLHAHSDTSYDLKLVHSALKALTKP